MVGNSLLGIFLRMPSHIHKELDGILHRLQIANIQNPHASDAEVVGQRQLFEHLLRLRDVEPLGVTWSTHIVHVIIDTPAALAATLFLVDGYTTDVAPVVVADENHHVVGHLKAGIIVVLYLFIQCPYLSGFLGRFARHFLDNTALVVDDTLHQLGVGLVAHGLIAIATHTDGHNVLSTLHTLDTLTEELVEFLLIGLVVPGAPLLAVAGILLMVAGHRLVVGGTHHHTHTVGQTAVLWIISIERPSPHGGPHHIALQTEYQFEDFLVERTATIFGTEGLLHPCSETGSFVVEEDAAKLNSRFAIGIRTFDDISIIVLRNRSISPPIPR